MTRERCEYCGQEERYGHNAICVMNTVAELRAEIERLQRTNAELLTVLKSIERTANQAAVMHSPEESKP